MANTPKDKSGRVLLRQNCTDAKGRFLPGNPGGTKHPGERHYVNTVLKEAILIAADELGEDGKGKRGLIGYLRFIAANYPKAYASLLGKVLPMQILDPQREPRVPLSVDEVRRRLAKRGILVDTIFDGPAELILPERKNGSGNGHLS